MRVEATARIRWRVNWSEWWPRKCDWILDVLFKWQLIFSSVVSEGVKQKTRIFLSFSSWQLREWKLH